MIDGTISVNGVISPAAQAGIPALDRGFLFGDNVFEVIVGFHGKLLDVDRHLARLRRSAAEIELDIPWSDAELTFEIEALASQIPAPKNYIRLVITRGNGLGLNIGDSLAPNRVIYSFAAAQEPTLTYKDGLSLRRRMLPYTERGPSAKTGNYLRSILALKQVKQEGYQDILWTNAAGEVTESSTANIFFIGREGDLVEVATPPAASGILLGITRDTLIQLLTRAKIRVTERIIYADEIARFDEAFLCSTVRGLIPVGKIDAHKLHTARASSVFRHFERLFLTWVESEIGFRVDWNTGSRL